MKLNEKETEYETIRNDYYKTLEDAGTQIPYYHFKEIK